MPPTYLLVVVLSPALLVLIDRLHSIPYLLIPVWPVPVLLGAVQLAFQLLVLMLRPVGVPGAWSAASDDDCAHALAALPLPVARRRMT